MHYFLVDTKTWTVTSRKYFFEIQQALMSNPFLRYAQAESAPKAVEAVINNLYVA